MNLRANAKQRNYIMNNIEINDLRNKLGKRFPIIKVSFRGMKFVEFYITNRVGLLENVGGIREFLSGYDIECSMEWVWEWGEVEYNGFTFTNPNPSFRFYISGYSNNKGFVFDDRGILDRVSDTTDPLYDICLLKLQDVMGYPIGNPNRLITNFCRMPYGFAIRGDSLAEVECIMGRNIFDRKMSWSKVGNREYEIRIYMIDKEHLFVASDKKQKKKISKVIKTKVDYSKLSKEELIKLLEGRDEG